MKDLNPRVIGDVVTVKALAEFIEVRPGTVRDYESTAKAERAAGVAHDGQIPARDGRIDDGRLVGWRLPTINGWLLRRPGRGARVDLRLPPAAGAALREVHRRGHRRPTPADITAKNAV